MKSETTFAKRSSRLLRIAMSCTIAAIASCDGQQDSIPQLSQSHRKSTVSRKPTVPDVAFAIGVPAPPPAELDGTDLSQTAPAILADLAFKHYYAGEYQMAAQCQYWAVEKGDVGRYNLACWESLSGDVDAAIFWLQAAARTEGVDTKWSLGDSDLKYVRRDPRWAKLHEFLRECEAYWRVAGRKTVVIVPTSYDGRAKLPLVVWLHGMAGSPTDLQDFFQMLANEYNIGFVGVSGPIMTEREKFTWADVVDEDYERIQSALAEASDQIQWQEGHVVALGFSQGSIVAIEVAVRHPEEIAGVISVSAGAGSSLQLDEVTDTSRLGRQGFVIVCGAKEHPASIARSNELERWLKSGDANVHRPLYPEHNQHDFPPDFAERLPEWLEFIDNVRAPNASSR